MTPTPHRLRRVVATAAIVGGASLGAAGLASAATTSHSSAPTAHSSAPTGGPHGAPGNPARLSHGPDETLLTGSDLTQATNAAEAAVSGATVIRAETNSSGASTYEVHMSKADGSVVTVLLDSNFTVTSTITGFGAGPAGQTPPAAGHMPAAQGAAPSAR